MENEPQYEGYSQVTIDEKSQEMGALMDSKFENMMQMIEEVLLESRATSSLNPRKAKIVLAFHIPS
jgi:hypothetical protein